MSFDTTAEAIALQAGVKATETNLMDKLNQVPVRIPGGDSIADGDVFTISTKGVWVPQTIGGREIPAVIWHATRKDSTEDTALRVFPGSFMKVVRRAIIAKNPLTGENQWQSTTTPVQNSGTAVDECRKYAKFGDFVKNNDGKKVKVQEVEKVDTVYRGEYRSTTIFKLDIVD